MAMLFWALCCISPPPLAQQIISWGGRFSSLSTETLRRLIFCCFVYSVGAMNSYGTIGLFICIATVCRGIAPQCSLLSCHMTQGWFHVGNYLSPGSHVVESALNRGAIVSLPGQTMCSFVSVCIWNHRDLASFAPFSFVCVLRLSIHLYRCIYAVHNLGYIGFVSIWKDI